MQSMKAFTDEMYAKIDKYETATKLATADSDNYDADNRDLAKKIQKFECRMEQTMESIQSSANKMEIAEKEFKDKDDDVSAQSRRVLLLEEESNVNVEKLAVTVTKLASISKEADIIYKVSRQWENKTMNNECEIEDLDRNMKEARKIGSDNEMRYDNLARSLSMMEDELKRVDERVKKAEDHVKLIEDDLQTIGENQKQLEISEEKARRREEKYQEQIKQINIRLKTAETRSEYAEMTISKLHHRIDELEDEIIREKMKIHAVSDQLDDTFNDLLYKY